MRKIKKTINTVFQPILNLKNNKIIGYEALSRPVAIFEEKNKIKLLAIDLLALNLAIDKAKACFPDKKNKIFINIRPETLIWLYKTKQKLFLPEILEGNIVLEITEQGNEKPELVKKAVESFNYEIAIDDISSGYNRLRYSNDLYPAYLKIDRPLIKECHRNERKQQMIKGIVQMGSLLGAEIIAEGIEKEKEKETLVKLGINFGQGFLLGKPMDYCEKGGLTPWENI